MAKTPVGKMMEGMIGAVQPLPEDGWTLGWDVVVSYSEPEINETLKKAWEKVFCPKSPSYERHLTLPSIAMK